MCRPESLRRPDKANRAVPTSGRTCDLRRGADPASGAKPAGHGTRAIGALRREKPHISQFTWFSGCPRNRQTLLNFPRRPPDMLPRRCDVQADMACAPPRAAQDLASDCPIGGAGGMQPCAAVSPPCCNRTDNNRTDKWRPLAAKGFPCWGMARCWAMQAGSRRIDRQTIGAGWAWVRCWPRF